MKSLYRKGMTNEVFAWTAASNNQGYLSGRLSLALNAISIVRSAESQNPDLARKTSILPIPAGHHRRGLEHVMGVYTIWNFTSKSQQKLAKRFIADLELNYASAFKNSKYYNFPAFPKAVYQYRKRLAADPHLPKRKYVILDTIARKYTFNVGYPGFSNAAVDEIFNKFLIPQMFAEVAQGKSSPADAARTASREMKSIFAKWRKLKKI
jgi:multiple sugar transport system substrate-binding protein